MDKEDKMCIKILQTLREMLEKTESFEEAVSTRFVKLLLKDGLKVALTLATAYKLH